MNQQEEEVELEIEDFNEVLKLKVVDAGSISLEEDDIEDPNVHIDLDDLTKYNFDFLKKWLIYRGDTLNNIITLKDAQIRVLHYFSNRTSGNLVDPTPQKTWLRRKAAKMGVVLAPFWKEGSLKNVPEILKSAIANPSDLTGWTKSLQYMPKFTVENINKYCEDVNNTFCKNSISIKKHFQRGQQFLEERFLDISTIFVKKDDSHFIVKGVVAASLKKANRWVFLAIDINTKEISNAYCQCPAGKAGTCSHSYAMMKLLAKWVVDRLEIIPEEKACTSKPCVWSVPQSRDKIEEVSIMELTIKSPPVKKQKGEQSKDQTKSDKKGISSTLYEPRKFKNEAGQNNSVTNLLALMKNAAPKYHATNLVNDKPELFTQTLFGEMPLGSILSYQCPMMPPDFNVYCNVAQDAEKLSTNALFINYPTFPFNPTTSKMDEYIRQIHFLEIKKLLFLEDLKGHCEQIHLIEESTRNQASNPEWFHYRKNRFTASLCNRFGKNGPKTSRGFKTLAYNLANAGSKVQNRVVQMKMEYGKFHEPIAIQKYERYMRLTGFQLMVDQSGLVIDKSNFVLGATPDGKVCCNQSFGILEVKCSEQYKDIDPKVICHISPNPCIVLNKDTGKISLNKSHTYYDQIQMQLALTCQTWCDFVFYTSKGLVIDRVEFDKDHWEKLQKKILDFYFTYLLPEIAANSNLNA